MSIQKPPNNTPLRLLEAMAFVLGRAVNQQLYTKHMAFLAAATQLPKRVEIPRRLISMALRRFNAGGKKQKELTVAWRREEASDIAYETVSLNGKGTSFQVRFCL